MANTRWTARDAGDLAGRRILITGGNSGIGFEAAQMLAGQNAGVVIACRNLTKGEAAINAIRARTPDADVSLLELDLADLASVEVAAERYREQYDSLDVLVNNAGVMALPYRQTVDGFEMQFGTNHLGHFALTGRLLDALLAATSPRVVTVSSGAHRAAIDGLDNVDASKGYQKWRAYATSKLANLLFTFELQRRVEQAGVNLSAVAAHPGYTNTNLQTAGPQMAGSKIGELFHVVGAGILGQGARMGALPTVYAAVADDVRGGDYIGPAGIAEMRGYPTKVHSTRAARDPATAAELWSLSQRLTRVTYDALAPGG